jgi:predicted metallo-beta-lactamase superfamily hydrolase
MSTHTLELIKSANPQVIMIGGPPFYLGGFKVGEAQLQLGLKNLVSVVEAVPLTILEHHALRDEQWQQRIKQVYAVALDAGHGVMTAAEFTGEKNQFLESKRKQLYLDNPPPKEFEKWMRQGLTKKSSIKPPI